MKTIDAHLSALMWGIARRRSADDEAYLRDLDTRLQRYLHISTSLQKYLSHPTDCACLYCKRVQAAVKDGEKSEARLAQSDVVNTGIDSSFCLAMANGL